MSHFKQSNPSNSLTSRTIYINPNFNKHNTNVCDGAADTGKTKIISSGAHINPLFLGAYRAPAIHMNPNFLKNKLVDQRNYKEINTISLDRHLQQDITNQCSRPSQISDIPILVANTNESIERKSSSQKIISKSRTKIVREPAVIYKIPLPPPAPPLIRLSSKKLVRRTHAFPAINLSHSITPASTISTMGKYKLVRKVKITGNETKSKAITSEIKLKRKTFVARYALQRSNSDPKMSSTSSKLRSLPVNKKLQMLNINGVLYRSTRNKLQRKDASVPPNQIGSIKMSALNTKSNSIKDATQKSSKSSYGRVLFVSGTKFILDKNGFKLTRIPPTCKENLANIQKSGETHQRQRQRIDIGGLTYIASTTQNVFVRTRNHLALAHLNTAKSRSLHLLTRRLVKSNIPCAIFQRLGKCIAHERGKCNRVHDKRQVTICPRFLRGECNNSECLLSHNVSLAKMPVCKFFLQGVCVRTDCPYLHKKLSVNADVCPDFLRGYCNLAQQCNKRHEFVCPEYERSGNCEVGSCIYCKNRKRKLLNEQPNQQNKAVIASIRKESPVPDSQEDSGVALRYFIGKNTNATTGDLSEIHADAQSELDSDHEMPSIPVRPKVGALPAFIPLSQNSSEL
ncbi:zinc finger CCCH domain-containing protein 3 [Anastrepha ludens]|uniref:zinc finger CCCH domain-containing protein 3 n=1 Tax=Anastrepha ludens TaxID=28586 RepID=UPI0023AF47E9|nr:zinc finger CCCH domain-containing protein 3 [Anastrepha ludens]